MMDAEASAKSDTSRRPNPAFWAGKRVLLTGHTGFKGGWAALWLESMGAEVTGLGLKPEEARATFYREAGVAVALASQLIDIRDRAKVATLMEFSRVDLVLHMAEESSPRVRAEDAARVFATNVSGSAYLFEALRRQPDLQAVLMVSNGRAYGSGGERACLETDLLLADDPYAASKAAAELVARSYAAHRLEPSGAAVGIARAGEVIGGGDDGADSFTAEVVRAVETGRSPVVRRPDAVRPWQHVLDAVAGYLVYLEALATDPETPRLVNFGPAPGEPDATAGELATAGLERFGSERPWRGETGEAELEERLRLDTRLAAERLCFVSRFSPANAMGWTVDWHAAVGAGAGARQTTLSQIGAYERLA